MANINRIKDVIQAIEENENPNYIFDMGAWIAPLRDSGHNVCGSQMCFAGWAVHQAGASLEWEKGLPTGQVITDENRSRHISSWAQEYLQLTNDEADIIFGGFTVNNDITKLKLTIEYALREKIWS